MNIKNPAQAKLGLGTLGSQYSHLLVYSASLFSSSHYRDIGEAFFERRGL
jgi:hypothetical protein